LAAAGRHHRIIDDHDRRDPGAHRRRKSLLQLATVGYPDVLQVEADLTLYAMALSLP